MRCLSFVGNGAGAHQRAGSVDDALAMLNNNRGQEEENLTASATAERLMALRLHVSKT